MDIGDVHPGIALEKPRWEQDGAPAAARDGSDMCPVSGPESGNLTGTHANSAADLRGIVADWNS